MHQLSRKVALPGDVQANVPGVLDLGCLSNIVLQARNTSSERRRLVGLLSAIGAIGLSLTLLSPSLCVGEEALRGVAYIPPGHEALFADMLGLGTPLPDSCTLKEAGVDRTLIRGVYSCAAGDVSYELRHSDEGLPGAARTDQFALVVVAGKAPDGLARALEARVRARESEFEWSWTPLPESGEAPEYFSTIGRAGLSVLLVLVAAVALGWWIVRSARRDTPIRASPLFAAVACTVLALMMCLFVHGALRLTGGSLAAIVRGEALTAIGARALAVFGAILASAVAAALLGRVARGRLLRLCAIAIAVSYTGIGYALSVLPDDLHYFGPLSTYPPGDALSETMPDQPQSPVEYRINARGFRYPDFEERKTEGTLRVALVGDSFVFGIGVNYDGTLRPHLESELARYWPDRSFEILNLGIPGNNLSSHVELVEATTARLDPDLVVLGLTLPNDLSVWDEQDARRDMRRYGVYSFARFLIGDSVESLWALMFLERETTPAGLERLDLQLRRLREVVAEAPGQPMLLIYGFQPWDGPIAARLKEVPDGLVVSRRTTTADEFIPGDGHPTSFGNQRSAALIAETLSRSPRWRELVNN